MSELFENLAALDDSAIIAHRKASAVATKRVKDRFAAFLANARDASDLTARVALVEDDLATVVAEVVAEYGGDAQKIEAAIKRSMLPVPGGASDTSALSAPGMGQGQGTCPQCGGPLINGQCATCQNGTGGGTPGLPGGAYGMQHTLPQAPSSGPVMAAGAYCDDCKGWKSGPNKNCTCSGDENDAGDSHEPGEDARESSVHTARRPKMCPYHSEVVDISLGAGDAQVGYNSMSAHAWGDKHCKGGYEGACNFRPGMVTQKYWDDKQAEYAERRQQRELDRLQQPEIAPEPELSIDTEPITHAEPLHDEPGKEGVSDIDGELADAPSAVGGNEFAMASSTKKGEALKTVDLPTGGESALGGPSPKIDKSKSGDESGWNLEPIDTQMDGSPVPTREQDPTAKPDFTKKEFLDQTDAVIKSETLPTSKNFDDAGFETERNITQYPTKTFGDNGTNPVTKTPLSHRQANQWVQRRGDKYVIIQKGTGKVLSEHASEDKANASFRAMEMHKHEGAVDPDKNPIRELLEEYQGFLMPNQVESALSGWDIG